MYFSVYYIYLLHLQGAGVSQNAFQIAFISFIFFLPTYRICIDFRKPWGEIRNNHPQVRQNSRVQDGIDDDVIEIPPPPRQHLMDDDIIEVTPPPPPSTLAAEVEIISEVVMDRRYPLVPDTHVHHVVQCDECGLDCGHFFAMYHHIVSVSANCRRGREITQVNYFWKCNCPMTTHVGRWSVGWSAFHNFPKGRVTTLLCSVRLAFLQ